MMLKTDNALPVPPTVEDVETTIRQNISLSTVATTPVTFAHQQRIHHLVFPEQSSQPTSKKSAKPPKKPVAASGLMNVEEAAAFLHRNVSVRSIYKAIQDGTLRAIRIGKQYYISPESLEDFIQCQDHDCPPDCANEKMTKHGLSMMEKNVSGLDAVTASVNRQKRPSENI